MPQPVNLMKSSPGPAFQKKIEAASSVTRPFVCPSSNSRENPRPVLVQYRQILTRTHRRQEHRRQEHLRRTTRAGRDGPDAGRNLPMRARHGARPRRPSGRARGQGRHPVRQRQVHRDSFIGRAAGRGTKHSCASSGAEHPCLGTF